MREHGWHSPDASSSAAPMRKRRPFSASRLMPRTTTLRRTSAPSTRVAAEVAGDGGEALGLDQRQLARAAGIGVAVADQAAAGDEQRDRLGAHRFPPRRPGADPDDDARADRRLDQAGERGGGIERHGSSNGVIAPAGSRAA